MKIVECQQNTPPWFAARCGIPTASCFDRIVTSTGEASKQRTKYLYQLAGERISGQTEDPYQSASMARGKEMEEEAKNLYLMTSDEEFQSVGFCLADGEFKYGASPDGLIGNDGGLEIKCPNLSTHVGYLLKKSVPTDYFQQVQGNLLITGRKWWDFVSYFPGIRPHIIRAYPDTVFLNILRQELGRFCNELEQTVKKLSDMYE